MAKQLNVNMNFTADTSNVESNLNRLKQSLNQISSTPIKMGNVNEDLKQATVAARQLQVHLNNAFSQKTGNLDLGKLQNSLNKSGQSLTQLSRGLLGAGKDGQQAFLQMQTAIHNANIQIKKSTGFLAEMGTTLKNSIRWQLSSSMIHGFMGGVQQATGYVKELNKSLTNIRIVTGKSTDDMAKFAEQANKSAKVLSSTTTAYTNAALIYYQQGLDDKAVKERTDATIKMSNVTGQSAEEVSSYMTAIWNNFDDGSKSLEHYADVITALGASTASSSKEIAEGLEKFAAIGKTVGLSYDYATTALATVVAQTRQSADVVGTAFKTLFARIQDLELGKTLDDGTTLGKYSQALEAVGVNIKDSQGNLKNMNIILDEMGAKWSTLSKDQQVALAQNVAGVRQYTQLIALMDNWDKFQQNLGVAQNSEGALQEQADIYAESWEGASKRVKASMQGIYSDLIDDKALIRGTNGLATFLEGIDKIINAAGGLQTILLGLSTVLMRVFQKDMVNGITLATQKMSNFGTALLSTRTAAEQSEKSFTSTLFNTGQRAKNIGAERIMAQTDGAMNAAIERYKKSNDGRDRAFVAQLETQREQYRVGKEIANLTDKISESKRIELETDKQILENLGQQKAEAVEIQKNALEKKAALEEKAADSFVDSAYIDYENDYVSTKGVNTKSSKMSTENALATAYAAEKYYGNENVQWSDDGSLSFVGKFSDYEASIKIMTKEYDALYDIIEEIDKIEQDSALNPEEKAKAVQKLVKEKNEELKVTEKIKSTEAKEIREEAKGKAKNIERAADVGDNNQKGSTMKERRQAKNEYKNSKDESNSTNEAYNKQLADMKKQYEELRNQPPIDLSKSFASMTTGAAQAATGVAMLAGSYKTLTDEAASTTDKLFAVGTGMTSLITTFNGAKTAISRAKDTFKGLQAAHEAYNAVQAFSNGMTGESLQGISKVNMARLLEINTITKGDAAKTADLALSEGLITTGQAEAITSGKVTLANEVEATSFSAVAAAEMAALWPIGLLVAALGLLAGAIYLVVKASKADEEALEQANKQLSLARDHANETTEAYNSLNTILDEIANKRKGLDELKEGTVEWQTAVAELNQQFLELADTYGLIYGTDYTMGADGTYQFLEGREDVIKEAAAARMNQANVALGQARINRNNAQNMATAGDVGAKYTHSEETGVAGDVTRTQKRITSTTVGFTSQTQLDVINAGLEDPSVFAAESTSEFREALIAQNKAFKNYSDEQIQGLYDYKDAFQEASVKVAQTNADSLGALEGIIASNNADNEEYINSDYKKVYSKVIKDNQEQRAKDAEKKWKDLNSNKDRAEQYLKDQYGDGTTYDETKYRVKNTGGRKFTVQKLNDDREWVTQGDKNGISYNEAKELRKTTASTKIDKDITTEYNKLITDAKTALGDSIDGLSKSAKDALITAKATKEAADFTSLTSKEIGELAKSNDSYIKEQLQNFDAKNQQTLNEKVKTLGLDNTIKYKDKNGKEYTQEDIVQEQLNALYDSQASYEDKALMMKVNITGDMIDENGNIDMEFFQRKIDEQRKLEFKAEIVTTAEGDKQAEAAGLKSEEVADYAAYLAELSKNEENAKVGGEALSEQLQDNANSAESTARQIMRMNQGVEKLSSNWEEWGSVLKKSSKGSQEYFEALSGTKDAIADLLDIESDAISSDFVEDHLKEIGKAAKGDAKAIDKLRSSLDEEIITKITAEINDKEIIKEINGLDDEIQTIASDLPDIEVGATLQDEEFLNAANELVESANMTADEANAYFAGIGYEPVYSTEDIADANSMQSPNAMTSVTMSGISWSEENVKIGEHELPIKAPTFNIQTKSTPLEPTDAGADVRLTSFSGDGKPPKIKGLRKKATGSANNSSSSNKGGKKGSGGGGGGGGSKKSHTSAKERYHTIDKQIGKSKQAYEALDKAKDRAYGAKHIKNLDAEIKLNQQIIEQNKQKLKEAQKYEKKDKKSLIKAADKAGISSKIKFDENGVITNYDQLMKEADAYLKKKKYSDKAVEEYDKFVEALKKYEETDGLIDELKNEISDAAAKELELKLEKIKYKVELKLNVNERDKKMLEQQLNNWNRLNEGGFKDAEYLNIYKNQAELGVANKKIQEDNIRQLLAANNVSSSDIENYMKGDASALYKYDLDSSVMEEIDSATNALLEAEASIAEALDAIYKAFGENLDIYIEKTGKLVDKIEHTKNIASAYKEILTLSNTLDSNTQNILNNFAVSAAKANAEAMRIEYATLVQEQAKLKEEAARATDKVLKKNIEEQIEVYQDAINEAQQNQLEAVEEMINALKTMLEESLQDVSKKFQKAVTTSYGSFANLADSLERDQQIEELYAPGYEKMYQLSKLTRDLQKEIDETDNIKAKQKLLNLQNKINDALAEGVKLTQYDLDRMQAEYDLELAKIALEDAKNAKDIVRMQRDNNGNWNYVYTADEDNILEAQQKYEDSLYNMRKLDEEHIKNIQTEIVNLQKEFYDAVQEVYLDETLTDEEKTQKLNELQEWYNQSLTAYVQELQRVVDNEEDLLTREADFYEQQTQRKLDAWGKWTTSFDQLAIVNKEGFSSVEEMLKESIKNAADYIENSNELYEEYVKNCNNALEEFGLTTQSITADINNMNAALDETIDKMKDLGKELAEANDYNIKIAIEASSLDDGAEKSNAIYNATTNYEKNQIKKFDTGGYTGSWNNADGKLAFLHQKELVLNETQTKDLLETIKLLENYILPTIKLAKFDKLNKKDTILDQNVTIQAEFPNVTNHLEIEEAFNNLINSASQYINKGEF